MIKTYSYEKGIAEQVVKSRFPGASGLSARTIIDVEALYHIEPDKMGNEFHFYYNGECIPAHCFQDIVNFVYQHIADKLMNNGYSHGLKGSLQEAEQSCQGQETESEQEQERE